MCIVEASKVSSLSCPLCKRSCKPQDIRRIYIEEEEEDDADGNITEEDILKQFSIRK